MGKIRRIFKEINNFFYIKKTIKKESSKLSGQWKSFNLRSNWLCRIYTVISLSEDQMGEEEIVRNYFAMEKMKEMNEYMSSLNFQEIVYPSIEKIPDSRSYLVVYSPLFRDLTFGWLVFLILFNLFIIVGLILLLIFLI